MSAKLPLCVPVRVFNRRNLLVVGLVALSLVLSALVGPAVAIGQPGLGFCERDCAEQFQVMGPNWSVRGDLGFSSSETVRVNVTSFVVDWNTNAGGGGTLDLILQRYDGGTVRTVAFSQVASVPARYTASMDLSILGLAPDWYYLRILIDDTGDTFEAMSAIKVDAAPAPHSIETYTDDTFTHPSDVFTTSSRVWVRVVGNAGEDPDRWDITEFLNGNSRVGGPRGNFDNFARNGNVYTFSIDLAQFPGALPMWWSYTLSARLTGGAFDAGKQIQIFDPGLTVAWSDIAPATAKQGQTDVPMLALTLSLPSNFGIGFGPAAYNLERIRVTRTGAPGTNADVAGVSVWDDVNGNGVLDGGDVRLGSRVAVGGVPFPAWVGQNGVAMTTVESSAPRRLIMTYDIAPTATVGNFAGARINGMVDFDFAGHFMSIVGLPAQSSDVRITAADILTVTNDPGQAPALAGQGATGVAVDRLRFSTNGATITVNELSIDLIGTGTSTDVIRVYLRIDDGNGVYDSATDVALGTPNVFAASGPAVFRNLGFAVNATPRDVWVVFDIAAGATIGSSVGSRLASNASVVATGGSVFGGNFPLDSGFVTIRGPLLTVNATDLAPAQVPLGRLNVPMLRLELSVDFGQTTVTALRVDKRGTSPADADVAAVKLYRDGDGDRMWTAVDALLDSSVFAGGATVFSPLNVVVTAAGPVDLFVLIDVSTSATVGTTIGVELRDETYVIVDLNSMVDPGPFVLRSSDALLVAQVLGTISGTVTDAQGNPLVGATVTLAGTGMTTTTDALGAYAFQDLPMGTYYVVAAYPGLASSNVSVTLTNAAPNKVVNFALVPAQAGLGAGTLVGIGAILGAILLAVLGLFLVLARRRRHCPICGKPKDRNRAVCPECEAKGLGPRGQAMPPPPPPSG